MKSKEEFLKEYRSKHTGMYVAAVLSVIFDIIGTVIILANVIPSKGITGSAIKACLTIEYEIIHTMVEIRATTIFI